MGLNALGLVSTGGGGGSAAAGGGSSAGGGASLDLSSFFDFLSPSAGGAAAPAAGRAQGTLSAWSRRIREMVAADDAENARLDAEAAAAAQNRGKAPGGDLMGWLRAHRQEVLIGAGVLVAVAALRRRR